MADIIDRSAAQSLIPPELVNEIIQGATRHSVALQIFKRGRNMLRDEVFMPALSMLPEGGWLNSDNAMKPLTDQAWEMVEMYAEEYASRVIIPDNVREDAVFDMWGEILPRLQEHYGKAFDQAVFMGINKPRRFRADLVTACYQAGAVVQSTTNINNDINNALSLVEQSGYDPTALVAGVRMKAKFRMNLDGVGRPLHLPFIEQLNKYYLNNGAWDDNKALMIVGDFSQAMYSVREDMTVKISADAATNYGGQLHSMFDEDSQVMRVKWRIGFAIPNPINILNQTNSRFPFAIIVNSEQEHQPTMYNVTFTATDSNSDPVQGVTVKFAGSNIKTDSNGQAVFKSQGNQEYIYQIRYKNQLIKNGSVPIESSDVSVPVTIN